MGSRHQKTNGMAIASLFASLIGFVPFCFFRIGSIIGIVLGIVALNQIKNTQRAATGCYRRHRRGGCRCWPALSGHRDFQQLTMTTRDPERPSQPFGGTEYPSLESSESQTDPTNSPVDYPMDARVAAPVYPPPYPGQPGYPGYYPGAYDPYRPTKPPGTNGHGDRLAGDLVVQPGLCCGATGFIGVILGIVGMRESKRTGQEGYGNRVDRRHHRRNLHGLLGPHAGAVRDRHPQHLHPRLGRRPERFRRADHARGRGPCPAITNAILRLASSIISSRASPPPAPRLPATCATRRPPDQLGVVVVLLPRLKTSLPASIWSG